MKGIEEFEKLPENGRLMPLLFIGHGNPMYGIRENEFTRGWVRALEGVPRPRAVLVVSAHWQTRGTRVTANERPPVIYDFGGFPQELFEARYDAAGDPELARELSETLRERLVALDEAWGLDHGAWTVLRHLYPQADVPVLQLSLDYTKRPAEHYRLARELAFLRRRGVLVVASGNLVHNLRMADFHGRASYDWAASANNKVKNLILAGEHDKLIQYENLGADVALAVPTPEHYLPLLYVLGAMHENEPVAVFNDALDLASISMTSVRIGKGIEN